jgi:hypothetical protein
MYPTNMPDPSMPMKGEAVMPQPEHISLAQEMVSEIFNRYEDPLLQNEILMYMHKTIVLARISELENIEKKAAYYRDSLSKIQQ